MSRLSATQIPKPADEQAFERACVVLWQGLLKDPNVQRVGRRGQKQNGVDIVGCRDQRAEHLVGIQCKLKGSGKQLTTDEIRNELAEALTFSPPLTEYFIVTTAPDDASLQALARQLTLEQHKSGRDLKVYIWGWSTLEEKISDDVKARKAFDDTFSPFGEMVLEEVTELRLSHVEMKDEQRASLTDMQVSLQSLLARLPADGAVDDATRRVAIEAKLDASIDDIRDVLTRGDAAVAQAMFEALWEREKDTASGRIRFRIEANIGACRLAQGDEEGAADLLIAAYNHAPSEPKAATNKVLGLLLKRQWEAAAALGRAALQTESASESLSSYVVQALRWDQSVDDPLADIPAEFHQTASVRVAVVDFQRARGLPEWRNAARALIPEFEEDAHARRFAAEADLDEILSSPDFSRRRILTPEQRVRVQNSVKTLDELWREEIISLGSIRPGAATLAINLIVGLHALEQFEAAIAIAEQGIGAFPDDSDLARCSAIVAMDAGNEAFVAPLTTILEKTDAGALVAFRYHANRGEWDRVAALTEIALAAAPAEEIAIVEVLGKIAALLTVDTSDLEGQLRALLGTVSQDPRAAVIIAGTAQEHGFSVLADEAYQSARSLLTPDSHIARRLMVAALANRREDWATVADSLDGWIDRTVDSPELRMLARAYVNESPVRRRGLRFFQSLPADLAAMTTYTQAAGLFHFNRGAPAIAEGFLRRASESGGLLATLALFETLKRQQRGGEIGPILDTLNPREMTGTPHEKMVFAQAMRDAGKEIAAADFAYEVLQSSRDDPEASLGYFLLLIEDFTGRLIPPAPVVALDTWVRLKSDDSSLGEFLIVSDGPKPSEGRVTQDHPLIRQAMGLKAGDSFVLDKGPVGPRTWQVEAIKHKYLYALHDVIENFETRFPGVPGFWRITSKDGDVQPALDMVKRTAEADLKIAALYLEKSLPMNMVAARVTGSSVSFADYIRDLGHDIQTTVGLSAEREAAKALIQKRRALGLVLDTYAAWTAVTMEALDLLVTVFGSLTVAQSTIDELRGLRDRHRPRQEENMTLSWQNGQFIRQVLTVDEATSRANAIDAYIEKICTLCTIAPVEAPDSLSTLAQKITQTFDPQVLDPVYLAGTDKLLLSEDQFYRDMAREAAGTSGVWMQSVLVWARDEGIVSVKDYATFIVRLAWRRHFHVGVDANSLVETLRQETDPELPNVAQLCRYFGGKSADIPSHVFVAAAFVNAIWRDHDISQLKAMKATSIVARAIIRDVGSIWPQVLMTLRDHLLSSPRHFLWLWIQGNFLETDELRKTWRFT
jgi:tetratricopeptide (TPR) repeat protein